MMDNTARVLTQTPEQLEQPAATPRATPKTQTHTRVHVSAFEKLCYFGLAVVACAVAVLTLNLQTSIADMNRTTQSLSHSTVVETRKIDNLEQAVSELTSADRLSAFAKAHGLTISEDSVKQAVK